MADRSIKISAALYERVKAVADAEQRTLSVTLERMCNGAAVDKNAIIDEWLDFTAKREVNARWDRVLRKKQGMDVRLDGR